MECDRCGNTLTGELSFDWCARLEGPVGYLCPDCAADDQPPEWVRFGALTVDRFHDLLIGDRRIVPLLPVRMAPLLPVPASRKLTSEQFEALLIEIRNGASETLSELVPRADEAKGEDARDVWHTAEFALGMLLFGRYFPKREALGEARKLVEHLSAD
jgi:hypothetical protein